MKYRNTLNRGSVRYIIFKEGDTWYGIALEFNIVEEGDDKIEVMASLFEAIQGYVETAQKIKMRPMVLNQKPDKEYQELWDRLEREQESKKVEKVSKPEEKVLKPEEVYTFGYSPFRAPAPALVS